MKKIITLALLFMSVFVNAQTDSTLFKRIKVDTSSQQLNMDAVYNRPFITYGKLPVSIGGYAEANWQHIGTEGISDGHQFQMRRMTLFISSTIGKKIKFLSEIEFEDGGREIVIEFASIDVEFHPLLNFRGGMIMNPIGAFNQNHDGPKWEFTERPISATQMLPATWSNAGFGVFGKTFKGDWMFGYEGYVSGGFDDAIIDNGLGRTSLSASKANATRFERSVSGTPLITTKIAIRNNKMGEIGLSYMGGAYNTFEDDGEELDEKRRLNVFAIDYNVTLPKINTFITAEWAWVGIDIPETYTKEYGSKQYGGFIDIVQPILKRKMFGWEQATLNLACRLEYVDWNVGRFEETNYRIGEEVWSITPSISFRPIPQTVFRLNYRIQRDVDFHKNDPEKTGGFSLGVSTYF